MPTIFVNQNGLCFLEQSRKSWKASRIKHLPANEARRYADTFQLHELKAYLAAVRTPSFA
ncbi:MAG TPA: hypothetical protein VHM90_13395, partial [Phycisphaerae bacterium]|jgi:hypothetical protein|nr:hypothetical protein [Phycisphaerae bacterium]